VKRAEAYYSGFLPEKKSVGGEKLGRFLRLESAKRIIGSGTKEELLSALEEFFTKEEAIKIVESKEIFNRRCGRTKVEVRALLEFLEKTWRRMLCGCTCDPECRGGLSKIRREEKLSRTQRRRENYDRQ
jgi:hypothetical protein